MKDRRNNCQICRHSKKIGVLLSTVLTWRNDNKWKAWICLDPLPSRRLFCFFTHSLSLSRPVDFAMLWSSCASRPSGYLDIAWSQSPVNQISSDLADPADKTLHCKRKWQTAGDTRPDYEGSVKRDWSQRLFKLKKAAKKENILLVPFRFFQFTLTESELDLIGKRLSFHLKKKNPSVQGVTSFHSQKDEWKREHFQ